jgi:group I intron endonuclease
MPVKNSPVLAEQEPARNYIIYCYTSPSGKKYIGQTHSEEKRKLDHKKAKTNKCRAFACAINKYGFDSFTYEVLDKKLTLSEANEKESFYIESIGSLYPNGYNLRIGGFNSSFSDETKKKMSLSAIKRTSSDEYRKAHSLKVKGYKHTDETKKRMSISHTGLKRDRCAVDKVTAKNKGRVFSDEIRKKMSLAAKGKKLSAEHKQNISNASKKMWNSMTIEQRNLIAIKKSKKRSEEQKLRLSEAAKKRWELHRQKEAIKAQAAVSL